jgi:hypothetical protein
MLSLMIVIIHNSTDKNFQIRVFQFGFVGVFKNM